MESLNLTKKDDRELVTAYLAGQDEALPVLINRHVKPVYRFIFGLVLDRSVAEDITQDVFVKVWQKLKSYNEKYSFKTWLFSVARNTTIDYWRKKKDVVFSEFENDMGDNVLLDTLADDAPWPEEARARIEEAGALNNILQKLPLLYREVLVMHYTDDLSIEEISQVLRRPMETVKSQHRRGLLHLKALLTRKTDIK